MPSIASINTRAELDALKTSAGTEWIVLYFRSDAGKAAAVTDAVIDGHAATYSNTHFRQVNAADGAASELVGDFNVNSVPTFALIHQGDADFTFRGSNVEYLAYQLMKTDATTVPSMPAQPPHGLSAISPINGGVQV